MSKTLAIGLMSGTSADGVSAVLAQFEDHSFKLIAESNHNYPEPVRQKIHTASSLSIGEISRLHVEIGESFAQAALRVMKKAHAKPDQIACIGSHGQTLYHGPYDSPRNTFQLGDPAVIAERTQVSVVSNFRQRDVAAGGEGAPLIPFFDHFFFGNGPVRAFQNIGGIGNVTVVGKGVKIPLAFDTGPGNCLMDLAMRKLTGGKESFDAHGHRAKQGAIDMAVTSRMVEHAYFKKPPPKSTGLETFNEVFLTQHFGSQWEARSNDVLATLNYFTCLTIQESYRNFIFQKYPLSEVIVSGGGVHNKTLMKKLECLFAPIPVKPIEALGIPSQAKEPLAFAFFGLRCLQNKVNHIPSCTGAKRECVLGSVTKA